MQITHLIELAESVLAPDISTDECEGRLFNYVGNFEQFIQEQGGALKAPADSDLRTQMEQLLTLHEQVLTKARQFLGETSKELAGLQKRGRAILAYTDTLPKSVSLSSNRKG